MAQVTANTTNNSDNTGTTSAHYKWLAGLGLIGGVVFAVATKMRKNAAERITRPHTKPASSSTPATAVPGPAPASVEDWNDFRRNGKEVCCGWAYVSVCVCLP